MITATVGVSCHTVLPYALARTELRATLYENGPTPQERRLVADVVTRVRAWNEVEPSYGDGDTTAAGRLKAVQSRGTEAALNALVVARRDLRDGGASEDARRAFANMFALQLTTGPDVGSWAWLDFSLRPFEWRRDNPDLFNRAIPLWVSASLPGLISNEERIMIVTTLQGLKTEQTTRSAIERRKVHERCRDGVRRPRADAQPTLAHELRVSSAKIE